VILAAADDLLRETDFRSLTVEEVMSRTDMRRPSFYNYFADRNALVMRLLERIENDMMQAAQPWLDSGEPRLLGEALDGVAAIYARHGHVLSAAHAASFHDAAVEQYYRHTLLQNFMDAVARRLRAERRAGRATVPDPVHVAHALLLMNAGVLAERLGRPPADRPAAVARTLRLVWARTVYGRDDLVS
jgi:AcrR family transcriptional regulator